MRLGIERGTSNSCNQSNQWAQYGVFRAEVVLLKTPPFRIVLPIVAGIFFVTLSWVSFHSRPVVDQPGWGNPETAVVIIDDDAPEDIGPPSDLVLIALNLPAGVVAVISFLPLVFLADFHNEMVLRTLWGLAAVGQWFLIGRFFDGRRGQLSVRRPSRQFLIRKALFFAMMVVGSFLVGFGIYAETLGHSSLWAVAMFASFAFWGILLVVAALRWRSSSASARERDDTLSLS